MNPDTLPNTVIPIADGGHEYSSIGWIDVNSEGTRAYVTTLRESTASSSVQSGGLMVFNVDIPPAIPEALPLPPATPSYADFLLEQFLGRFSQLGEAEHVQLMRPPSGEGGDWIFMTAREPGSANGVPNDPVLLALPEPIVAKHASMTLVPPPPGSMFLATWRPTDLILVGQGPGGYSRIQFLQANGFAMANESFGGDLNPGGEVRISGGDVDGDGITEILMTFGEAIEDEQGNPVAVVFIVETDGSDTSFYVPTGYAQAEGGLSLTAGDVDGDGLDEILTADRRPTYHTGTQIPYYPVKIFDFDPVTRVATFKATFAGAEGFDLDDGVDLAVGELDADSTPEIVVSFRGDYDLSGTQVTAVRVFDDDATPGTFVEKFAFVPLSGTAADRGMTPAAGDVDGDGEDEIIVGQRGVTMLDLDSDGTAETPSNSVLIYDRSNNWASATKILVPFMGDEATGADVAVGNFDGDARLEIVVGQEAGATSRSLIRLYGEEGSYGTHMASHVAFLSNENASAGVNVATGR